MPEISLEAFLDEARTFLEAHAPRRQATKKFVWGEGSDRVGMFEDADREAEREQIRRAKEWRRTKFDAGFGWIGGPERYGGRALPSAFERAYQALEAQFETPSESVFTISLGMVAPTILAHGSDEAKDAYLRKLWSGEIIGCQLFSEPGAGSDIASLQTRAERDGEEWVITGQKVWTTFAQHAEIGEIIARTDADQPKHRGITGFIVDMHAPGVEVRPLRQMSGGSSFNEVFFNEVRVADDHRLGEVNDGWGVALTTLMNERAAIGTGSAGGNTGPSMFTRLVEMAHHYEVDGDAVIRDQLANLFIHSRVAAYTNQRAMDKIKAGQLPGPEMSIAKLAGTQNMRRSVELIGAILGPRLIADSGEWGTYAFAQLVTGVPGARIAGGTDEVMRNIVGERVLGLPKDPGIDSKTPFKDLKVGTQRPA